MEGLIWNDLENLKFWVNHSSGSLLTSYFSLKSSKSLSSRWCATKFSTSVYIIEVALDPLCPRWAFLHFFRIIYIASKDKGKKIATLIAIKAIIPWPYVYLTAEVDVVERARPTLEFG